MFLCGDDMGNKIIKKENRMKDGVGRNVFVVCNTLLLILLSFLFIAPYLNVFAKALNSAKDTALGGVGLFPRKLSWDNFDIVLKDSGTWQGFKITILRVIIGSLFSLAITYMAAYALLKKHLWGRVFFVSFLTIPMFIGGGLIANYIIFAKIGIYNTFWVYIFPSSFSFFYMVIIRTYLQSIPESLREAARIDGASELRIMWSVMLPLSMPIVATILLWNAVGHWNDWTTTLYYINSPRLYTLQYNLQISLKETEKIQQMIAEALASGRPLGDISSDISGESVQAAQIIVSTLPVIVLYPFLQKYFIKGVTLGGVKE